jgi:hypothetical protein
MLIKIDSNAILVEPMQNRQSGEMVATYQTLVGRLKDSGFEPKMHILDNECSAEFKEAIKKNEMKFQLVPPHDHRRNIAEKAIPVFKDHFVAVLCGTSENFPMQLWCRILRQAEHQLNLLRRSRVGPTQSSFKCLHGTHNYNANPLRASRVRSCNARDVKQEENLGSTHQTGLLPGNLVEPLQMP